MAGPARKEIRMVIINKEKEMAQTFKRTMVGLMLVAMLLFTAFAQAGEKTEISFWVPFSGGDGDFMKAMVAKYNESQNEAEVNLLIHKWSDYYIKLRTAAAGGRGPDLAVVHTSQIASMMRDDLIIPMDEPAAKVGVDWKRFSPGVLAVTVADGKHMSIPLDTHCIVLYVNTKLAREAGLLNPDGTVKLQPGEDNFLEFLRTYKKIAPSGNIALSCNMDSTMAMWMWWSLYSQLDGKLLSADGTKAAFNNPEAARALAFQARLVSEGLWPKGLKSGYEVFKAGKGLAIIEGVWATGDYDRAGVEFTVLPFPNIFGKFRNWGDGHTLALTKRSGADAAKDLAATKFAYWLAENGYEWALSGQIPSMPEIMETAKFKQLPHRDHLAEIAKYISFMPASPKLDPVKETLLQNFNQFIATFPDPAKMLERTEKDVNRVLSR